MLWILLAVTILSAYASFSPWRARGREIVSDGRPRIMGIVNVTPDSFSESGRPIDQVAAIEHGLELVREGADLLDIGGESSRPGAQPITVEEELSRILPVVEALAGSSGVPVSVDTAKPAVARAVIRAGAAVINDIQALANAELARVVAESDAGVVLMHMAGTPQTMQINPSYDDVVGEVRDFLARRADSVESLGITRERIAIDPGIGFGKTLEHNLLLLRNLGQFANLGCTLVIGTSRKGFLGKLTGRPVTERAASSAVSSLAAAVQGASVLRVHDVGAMADALKVWEALCGWNKYEPGC
jgi:dihydropteroate synthase